MTRLQRYTLPSEVARIFIGYDRAFDNLSSYNLSAYPPYNFYPLDENKEKFCLEMAIAGFKKEDLNISVTSDHILKISGKKALKEEREYIHRGLSERNFERQFPLYKDLEVESAECEDGILKINIKNTPNKGDEVISIK